MGALDPSRAESEQRLSNCQDEVHARQKELARQLPDILTRRSADQDGALSQAALPECDDDASGLASNIGEFFWRKRVQLITGSILVTLFEH